MASNPDALLYNEFLELENMPPRELHVRVRWGKINDNDFGHGHVHVHV